MTNTEALDFLRSYFDELFVQHNLAALDGYLHPDYFDDDIGDPNVDHRQNSMDYLRERFEQEPTLRVAVRDAMAQDDVLSAFLEWSVDREGVRNVIRKGVAIFVLKDRQILKRHTFVYFEA